MLFFLQTFGCKSNQYESQALREALLAAGHVEATTADDAEVFVLNSCGVTGRAGASCRNAVRKALRRNPGLRVVITGCGVDLGERWPDVDPAPVLVPNAQKHGLARLLASWDTAIPDDRFALGISRFDGHTRAFLKIQDGCDNFCSYCAVPLARGAPESRAPEDAVAEARRLVANGHAELVLTGINIGAYAHPDASFPDLVRRLADTPGLTRLRLGSVEPPFITEALVQAMRDHPAVCPHLHLPLQSGDDGVLRAMGRRYSRSEFLEKAAMLRERLPLPSITTDIIVGFPGEDAAAFANSVSACEEAGFSRLHVFLFSPRPGTAAATLPRTTPDREIEQRKTALIRHGHALAERFAAACVGLEERAVFEQSGTGLTDRYVRVHAGGDFAPGTVAALRITAASGGEVEGTVLNVRQ